MNKKIIVIIKAILFIIIALVLLIVIDYIRIKNFKGTKPIITVKEEIIENMEETRRTYYGLGYSVQYYSYNNSFTSGTRFLLFNIIQIWFIEAQ